MLDSEADWSKRLCFNILTWISCFILVGCILGLYTMLLRILGRLSVKGKNNLYRLGRLQNVLFIANHPSKLDAVLVPLCGFWPKVAINPFRYLPWQTPGQQCTFIRLNGSIRLLPFIKCLAVNTVPLQKQKNAAALRKLIRILPQNVVLIFPEGKTTGRAERILCYTKTGIPIGEPQSGIGALIAKTNPVIVPVLVKGAEKVWPDTKRFPNFLASRIEIIFGQPFSIPQRRSESASVEKHTYQWYAQKAMSHLTLLDDGSV